MHFYVCYGIFYFLWRLQPNRGPWPTHSWGFYNTHRRTTVGRSPLYEWSAHRRNLYLTTDNTHNRHTSMSPDGIRPHNLSRRAAAELRLRPRGHWDRHGMYQYSSKIRSDIYIFNFGCLLSGHSIFMWARMWGSVVILASRKGSASKETFRIHWERPWG